jgi:hypothetical protein
MGLALANEDNEIDEDCAGLHQADAVFAVDDRRKPMGLGTYSNCDLPVALRDRLEPPPERRADRRDRLGA